MLICDGLDNTGKTTLANRLCQEFKLHYMHSPSEYRYDRNKMMDWVLGELIANREAIYDRFSPITDQVYSPILRGENPYGDTTRGRIITELVKQTPHLIIYCRPDIDRIIGFSDGREQMEGVEDNAVKLLKRYDELMNSMIKDGWNIIVYNYERPKDYMYVQRAVKQHLKEMRMKK